MQDPSKKPAVPEKGRLFTLLVIAALFIIGTVQVLNGSSGFVTAEVDDVHLGVCGTYGTTTFIELSNITDIQLVSTFDFGSCLEGESTQNTVSGLYSNTEYEHYTAHAYTDVSSYIIVTHKDGVLVFNRDSQKMTESLYSQLVQSASFY